MILRNGHLAVITLGVVLAQATIGVSQEVAARQLAEEPRNYPVVDCGNHGAMVTGWDACFGVNPRGESGTVYRLNDGTVVFFIRADYTDKEAARAAYRRKLAEATAVYRHGRVRDERGRIIGLRAVMRHIEEIPPETAGPYSGSDHHIVILRTSGNQVYRIAGPSVRAVTSFEQYFVTWDAPN